MLCFHHKNYFEAADLTPEKPLGSTLNFSIPVWKMNPAESHTPHLRRAALTGATAFIASSNGNHFFPPAVPYMRGDFLYHVRS